MELYIYQPRSDTGTASRLYEELSVFNSKKIAIQFQHKEGLQENKGELKVMKMLQVAIRDTVIKTNAVLLCMYSNG